MNNLMGFGNPALSPGLKLTPELAGRYGGISDLLYRPDRDKAEVQLLVQMPRRIQGNYRPAGVFGSPPPNLDSPFMDERIKRGFVPMTPPPGRGGGPQLPGFVEWHKTIQNIQNQVYANQLKSVLQLATKVVNLVSGLHEKRSSWLPSTRKLVAGIKAEKERNKKI